MRVLMRILKKKQTVWAFLIATVAALAWLFVLSPAHTLLKYRLFPDHPKNASQTLRLKNLNSKAAVYFDSEGIPHIEASNLADLCRAVGFVQARYRGFQLDLLRKFAAGRLSELLGNQEALNSSTVEFDLAMRGWGFEKKTDTALAGLPPRDRTILAAFSDGVNQGMRRYPSIEHRLLGTTPQPWTHQDTLLVGLLQAWSITHNWEQEALRFAMALELGAKKARELFPLDPFYDYGTLKNSRGKANKLPAAAAPEALRFLDEIARKNQADTRGSHIRGSPIRARSHAAFGDLSQIRPAASNAWVVDGELGASGKPILHNDMHLTHSLPSLIFLQHIKMPGLNAAGASMPGLPFLISGYNGKVAWGVTSASADVVDLVIEKEDADRPGFVLNQGRDCALKAERVLIKVKDGEDRNFTLRRTCNGPLLNDMYPGLLPENAPMLAVRYRLPRVEQSMGSLLRANRAGDVFQLRAALMKVPSPVQNIMAADHEGNIAFFSTGSVPKRKGHRGVFPIPGWLEKYEWRGWRGPDEMPRGFNPESGYFANANNYTGGPFQTPDVFHIDAAPSHRFDRITERIEALPVKDQESLRSIQKDNFLVRAQKLLPHWLPALKDLAHNPLEKKALSVLRRWDFSSDANSAGNAIFMALYRHLSAGALESKLSPALVHAFFKQRYSSVVADTWMIKEKHPAWDDPATARTETRADALRKAFRKSLEELSQKLGDDPAAWAWGRLHYHRPTHAFGNKGLLSFFNLKKTPMAGGLDSVWKAHFDMQSPKAPYKVVAGPVYRFSIDLGAPQKAGYSSDTGASGWPLSPRYSNQYEKWQKGELISIERDFRKLKKANAARKMELVP